MANIKRSTTVDFSYRDNALRATYDDESTLEMWTKAIIDDYSFSFMFYGDEQFDKLSDEDIIEQMKAFARKPETKKLMGLKSPDDLEYHLYRYRMGDPKSMEQLAIDLTNFRLCRPMRKSLDAATKRGNKEFVEYASWNGAHYDLILNVVIEIAAKRLGLNLTPKYIRKLSDLTINCNVPDWKKGTYFEEHTRGVITKKAFDLALNLAIWSDGHIDYAKLAKSAVESKEEKVVPPGLKKEMARFGMDIIIDDSVSYDEYKIWTDEDLNNLVDYNFNDVLGTREIGKNEVIVSELAARDAVRVLYPYTSARAISLMDVKTVLPPERDITSAQLAGLVLIGPNRVKPVDWPVIFYRFPLPDLNKPEGERPLVTQDVLEYIKKKEEFIHPDFITFFEHFRGKDTRELKDDYAVKLAQPITHQSAMNVPYYRKDPETGEFKPIDSYIRVSTGGAHGSTCANLHKLTEDEIKEWIRKDTGVGAQKENRFTVDDVNVVHADFASFYPMMAKRMEIYKTAEGIDRYSPIIDHRIKIKAEAEELKEADMIDSPEYAKLQSLQLAFKLILNATTGAGNMHSKYTSLPLDNKTTSMRLIGNMLIWVLGQRLINAGAFVISTNTDGLYVNGIDMAKADAVLKQYVKDYDMPVSPEHVARFINATTSTRVEFDHHVDKPSRAGGTLGHAINLSFSPFALGRNVAVPLISANAVLNYMAEDLNWLRKPYDRSRLIAYIEKIRDEGAKNEQAWYHVHSGTKSKKITLDGERLQKVNRVVFTKSGGKFGGEELRQINKDLAIELWNKVVIDKKPIKDFKFTSVDFFEWDNKFLELIDSDEQITFDFIKKEGKGKSEKYVPTNNKVEKIPEYDPKRHSTKSAFIKEQKAVLDSMESKILGYRNPKTGDWSPIKIWKMSDKISNYPHLIGKTLNTKESLSSFDYNELDIEAYVAMAEEQLKLWKRTANVPELNMTKIDDTVVASEKVVTKRLTKKEKELEKLTTIYYNFDNLTRRREL